MQKAFELYRSILMPILMKQSERSALVAHLERLISFVSYTIHKFSDYFQALSEKQIRDYAQTLEVKVEERTKEIADSEDKYRTLVEEDAGRLLHKRGREKIIYANRSYCEMYGYTLEEVIGRLYTDFVAPESLEDLKRIYDKRVSGTDRKEQYTFFRLHKDGRSLPTENRVNLVRYQGKIFSFVTCCDITERIRIEERIREAERLAHIGQLTTSLAHEVRNPLTATRKGIQMLIKRPVLPGSTKGVWRSLTMKYRGSTGSSPRCLILRNP